MLRIISFLINYINNKYNLVINMKFLLLPDDINYYILEYLNITWWYEYNIRIITKQMNNLCLNLSYKID